MGRPEDEVPAQALTQVTGLTQDELVTELAAGKNIAHAFAGHLSRMNAGRVQLEVDTPWGRYQVTGELVRPPQGAVN